LLIASLSMIGPFAIDTYLPAFRSIGSAIGATPVAMQQTLSVYLFGFAIMTLFHGALSDSLGRKPVILTGVILFALASIAGALATSLTGMLIARALQGMSAGAGMIVGRALIRDVYDEVGSQKMMSLATIFFGVAPALAPLIGGILYTTLGWESIFYFLALFAAWLAVSVAWLLPETLPALRRQAFSVTNLASGYREVGLNGRFLLLAIASGIPFNGFFVYVLSAPSFLGDLLRLKPEHFWWFFIFAIIGIMGGSALSGKLAGKIPSTRQVKIGFLVMAVAASLGLVAALTGPQPLVFVHFAPVGVYCIGWAMVAPAITVQVLNLFPARRGMASSLQGFVGSLGNTLVAAVIAPFVMHSLVALATASVALFTVGWLAWRWERSLPSP
jgi:MFS transporter, DHA1 family, multidrug resistance protein